MSKIFATLTALSLLALPALAGDDTIYSGIDAWHTPSDGSTFADFYLEPIPADFFCEGSGPWTGRIPFGGEPLKTLPEGALGNSDTVLLRHDDATFDERGVASTRLQMQALNLVGLQPVKTSCGEFTVRTLLDGEQPMTEMKIIRTSAKDGHFLAPVAVNARVIFTPVKGSGESLEMTREIVFDPSPEARWISAPVADPARRKSSVIVDSDGDGQPDLALPSASNFITGLRTATKDSFVCEDEEGGELNPNGLTPVFSVPGETIIVDGGLCTVMITHEAPNYVHNVQTGQLIYNDGTVLLFEEP